MDEKKRRKEGGYKGKGEKEKGTRGEMGGEGEVQDRKWIGK